MSSNQNDSLPNEIESKSEDFNATEKDWITGLMSLLSFFAVLVTSSGYIINNFSSINYGFNSNDIFSIEDYFMAGMQSSIYPILTSVFLYLSALFIKKTKDISFIKDEYWLYNLIAVLLGIVLIGGVISLILPLTLSVMFLIATSTLYLFSYMAFVLTSNIERGLIMLLALFGFYIVSVITMYGSIAPHIEGSFHPTMMVNYTSHGIEKNAPAIIKGGSGTIVHDIHSNTYKFINEKYIVSHNAI